MKNNVTAKIGHSIAKVLVCIDGKENYDIAGFFQTIYMDKEVRFNSIVSFINYLEEYFDKVDFPQAFAKIRTFKKEDKSIQIRGAKNMEPIITEQTLITNSGEKATFVIQVLFRQNASWQGTVTWSEKQLTRNFRSTLELIRLMDSVLEKQDDFDSWN